MNTLNFDSHEEIPDVLKELYPEKPWKNITLSRYREIEFMDLNVEEKIGKKAEIMNQIILVLNKENYNVTKEIF